MHSAIVLSFVMLLLYLLAVSECAGMKVSKLKKKPLTNSNRPTIISCCGKTKCSKAFAFSSKRNASLTKTVDKKGQQKIASSGVIKETKKTQLSQLTTSRFGTGTSKSQRPSNEVSSIASIGSDTIEPQEEEEMAEATSNPTAEGKTNASMQTKSLGLSSQTESSRFDNTLSTTGSTGEKTLSSGAETASAKSQVLTFTSPSLENNGTTISTLMSTNIINLPSLASTNATLASPLNSTLVTVANAAITSATLTTAAMTTLAMTTMTVTNSAMKNTKPHVTTTVSTTMMSLCKDPCITYKNATDTFMAANNVTIHTSSGNYLMVAGKMIYVDSAQITLAKLKTDLSFWTSGANGGEKCELDQAFTLCSLGTRVQRSDVNVTWVDVTKQPLSTERCVTMETKANGNFGLDFSQCTAAKSVLCEPNCESATCPATCSVDASLFDGDKNLKNVDSLGFWAKDVCSSYYFFGNTLATWEKNLQRCCSMGMKPIVFETTSEIECLSGWKYNLNYWTGGTQRSCKGQWSWCAGADSVAFPDTLPWAFKQPDNRAGADDCIHMRLLQNETGIVLADRNCSDKYVVACEGVPKLEKCLKSNCQNVSNEKNITLFSGTQLNDIHSYGRWLSACGKTVFFSKANNTWAGAMRVCRSIGTDLLAVEYDDKDKCIAKFAKKHRAVHNLDYWTSGSQKDCPGKLSWCSLDRPMRNQNLSWADSSDGDCVSVNYGPNATSTFTKTNCDKQLPFICEVNKEGTFAETLQAECMAVWDISIAKFLVEKCIIEQFSFGGMLPSANLLRTIEDVCKEDDEKIQQSFGDFEKCSGIRKQDECETASEIYQCGRDANLPIMDQIYTVEKRNATVFSPPVASIANAWRSCKMLDLPCAIMQERFAFLMKTDTTTEGNFVTTPSGIRYFVGFPTKMTWLERYEYCCTINMTLATFSNKAAIVDYVAVMPSHSAYSVVDEVYETGDGENAWCSNHQTVPKVIVWNYQDSQNFVESCFFLDGPNLTSLYIPTESHQTCQRNGNFANFVPALSFICM